MRYGYLMSYLYNKVLSAFVPPQKANLLQYLDGTEQEYTPDPATYSELVDKSDNGYNGLIENTPTVVNAGDGDRAVLFIQSDGTTRDTIDPAVCFEINENFKVSFKYQSAVNQQFDTILFAASSSARLFYIQVGAGITGNFNFINSANANEFTLTHSTLCDNNPHEIEIYREGNDYFLTDFGVVIDSTTSTHVFEDMTGCTWGLRDDADISEYYLWDIKVEQGSETLYDWPCDDGAGNIISDVSGKGNNGTLFDETPTSAWNNDICRLRNIDPSGTLETEYGLTAGTLNTFLNRAELDTAYSTIQTAQGKTIAFITPNRIDSLLSDETLLRTIMYQSSTTLFIAEIAKNQKQTGRGLIPSGATIVNDDEDTIVDDDLNELITD